MSKDDLDVQTTQSEKNLDFLIQWNTAYTKQETLEEPESLT